ERGRAGQPSAGTGRPAAPPAPDRPPAAPFAKVDAPSAVRPASTAGAADFSLFRTRLRDLTGRRPVTCPAATAIAEAARLMTAQGVGSVIVVDGAGRPLGIVTDRDLRTRVVAAGVEPGASVATVMSSPLVSLEADRFAFDALLEMTRRAIHHLGVVEAGRLVGVVSSEDFVTLQGAYPASLAREIETSPSFDELAQVVPRLTAVVRRLAAEGAGPFHLGQLVAELNDRLVQRAVALAEAQLAADGWGRAPLPYAWLAAGSEGRREQTFRTDQDNGLVYEDPPAAERDAAAGYFARLAGAAGAGLVRIGFPLCPGGFMASNPRWCQPRSVWQEYFRSWMAVPQPDRLLCASVYLDLRPVAGEPSVGRALWEWVCDLAPSQTLFHRHLARLALDWRPPLGLFGRLAPPRSGPQRGRLDLKQGGVLPVTQAMRVYAVQLGVRETNTRLRLAACGARGIFTPAEVEELEAAYEAILRVQLVHQLACLEAGLPPDNLVDPRRLGRLDRLLLREALRTVRWMQRGLEERFMTALLP
ncbi:MAG TPA: DUF294 nucleotidyltransferase-like domain-containing protein, partial [Thermodesulfobacteriota bacterium]|nr:DUF294 nucleotidyltransferase-like domain-containing protein [Thermodesulfobacteriota bacterium]